MFKQDIILTITMEQFILKNVINIPYIFIFSLFEIYKNLQTKCMLIHINGSTYLIVVNISLLRIDFYDS